MMGKVTEEGEPVVELEVGGRRWRAIIDTGFNGDLELPEVLKSIVNARFLDRIVSVLAGDQEITEDCFLVDFPFDGQNVMAAATFSRSSTILIGTHLLREHDLLIRFLRGEVTLEREVF